MREILSFSLLVCFVFAAVVANAQAPLSPGKNFKEVRAASTPSAASATVGAGNKEVAEFFMYRCPHCRTSRVEVDAWRKNLPKGTTFRRVPLVFGPLDLAHASMYYTLESLGKLEELDASVFQAVLTDKKLLSTPEEQAIFFQEAGIAPEAYMKAYNAFSVKAKASQATRETQALAIETAPSLVVAGRYVTDPSLAGSASEALRVAGAVLDRIIAGDTRSLAGAAMAKETTQATINPAGTNSSASPPAVASTGSQRTASVPAKNSKPLCGLMSEEWARRQAGETREKYPFLAYLRVSGPSSNEDGLVHEFDLKQIRRCAKDDADFRERAKWVLLALEQRKQWSGINCGGILGKGGPGDKNYSSQASAADASCKKYPKPAGFDQWFAKYQQDAEAALAWAQANFVGEAASTAAATSARDIAAENCAARLKSVQDTFNSAQRSIPQNSVVMLSEATMWMIAESIKIIESTCPNSEQYVGQPAQFRQTFAQTKQVCDRSSTRPCIAQLPGREPAPLPAQMAPALKPLENKPPANCETSSSTGPSFISCARDACAKGGGSFGIGSAGCAGCTIAGGSWTLCPKGSGGVSSAQ